LLVDDEMPILNMFEKVLKSLKYKVDATNDSYQALKMFTDDLARYDLVITDMTMPGLTGDKLAAEIKGVRPDMPVILCTGFSELISEENVTESGIDRVLMKPIIRQDLARAIREVLDNHR